MIKSKARKQVPRLDLIGQIKPGQRYGKYTTTDKWLMRGSSKFVICICDCGMKKAHSARSLIVDKVSKCLSCKTSEQNFKHGQNTQEKITYEYRNWQNLKHKKKLCETWSNDFITFFKESGPRPVDGYILLKRHNSSKHSQINSYWGHPKLRYFKNLEGMKFGQWIVIQKDFEMKRHQWLCQCSCGRKDHIQQANLLNGISSRCKSCAMKGKLTKHGHSKTSVYNIFYNMKYRCYSKTHKNYPSYGGRGIKICDRWLKNVENFINDMGPRPSIHHSVDRIDNNGDYCPENCKWATQKTQCKNRRNMNKMQIELNELKQKLKKYES